MLLPQSSLKGKTQDIDMTRQNVESPVVAQITKQRNDTTTVPRRLPPSIRTPSNIGKPTRQQQLPLTFGRPNRTSTTDKKKSKNMRNPGLSLGQTASGVGYVINHGNAKDVARFLMHQSNVDNTPAEALRKIQQMTRYRVPTWEEAAAAVFSSTDESLDNTPLNDSQDRWAASAAFLSYLQTETPVKTNSSVLNQTDADESIVNFFEDATPGWTSEESKNEWANSAMYPSYIVQDTVHEMKILGHHNLSPTPQIMDDTTDNYSTQHYQPSGDVVPDKDCRRIKIRRDDDIPMNQRNI